MGLSLYMLVYGKACYLPIELEHKTYWAIMFLKFDEKSASRKQLLKLDELERIKIESLG